MLFFSFCGFPSLPLCLCVSFFVFLFVFFVFLLYFHLFYIIIAVCLFLCFCCVCTSSVFPTRQNKCKAGWWRGVVRRERKWIRGLEGGGVAEGEWREEGNLDRDGV